MMWLMLGADPATNRVELLGLVPERKDCEDRKASGELPFVEAFYLEDGSPELIADWFVEIGVPKEHASFLVQGIAVTIVAIIDTFGDNAGSVDPSLN